MIAWLRTQAGSPAALPSAADIAAEEAALHHLKTKQRQKKPRQAH